MKDILIVFLKLYKKHISFYLRAILGSGCRFNPTCSSYAIEAIERFGVLRGSVLALKRFLRCQPFTKPGLDPVPDPN